MSGKKYAEHKLFLIFSHLFFALIMCADTSAESKNTITGRYVTITGRVQIHLLDRDDKVAAVLIETKDDERYIVIDNAPGKELCKTPGADVRVTGIPGTDTEGNKTITVKSYEKDKSWETQQEISK